MSRQGRSPRRPGLDQEQAPWFPSGEQHPSQGERRGGLSIPGRTGGSDSSPRTQISAPDWSTRSLAMDLRAALQPLAQSGSLGTMAAMQHPDRETPDAMTAREGLRQAHGMEQGGLLAAEQGREALAPPAFAQTWRMGDRRAAASALPIEAAVPAGPPGLWGSDAGRHEQAHAGRHQDQPSAQRAHWRGQGNSKLTASTAASPATGESLLARLLAAGVSLQSSPQPPGEMSSSSSSGGSLSMLAAPASAGGQVHALLQSQLQHPPAAQLELSKLGAGTSSYLYGAGMAAALPQRHMPELGPSTGSEPVLPLRMQGSYADMEMTPNLSQGTSGVLSFLAQSGLAALRPQEQEPLQWGPEVLPLQSPLLAILKAAQAESGGALGQPTAGNRDAHPRAGEVMRAVLGSAPPSTGFSSVSDASCSAPSQRVPPSRQSQVGFAGQPPLASHPSRERALPSISVPGSAHPAHPLSGYATWSLPGTTTAPARHGPSMQVMADATMVEEAAELQDSGAAALLRAANLDADRRALLVSLLTESRGRAPDLRKQALALDSGLAEAHAAGGSGPRQYDWEGPRGAAAAPGTRPEQVGHYDVLPHPEGGFALSVGNQSAALLEGALAEDMLAVVQLGSRRGEHSLTSAALSALVHQTRSPAPSSVPASTDLFPRFSGAGTVVTGALGPSTGEPAAGAVPELRGSKRTRQTESDRAGRAEARLTPVLAARRRRQRIAAHMHTLQRLVPGGSRVDTASVLEDTIAFIRSLIRQVQALGGDTSIMNWKDEEQSQGNQEQGGASPATEDAAAATQAEHSRGAPSGSDAWVQGSAGEQEQPAQEPAEALLGGTEDAMLNDANQ